MRGPSLSWVWGASLAIAVLAPAAAAQQTYSIQSGLWGNAGLSAPTPLVGQTLCNGGALRFGVGLHATSPASTPDVTTSLALHHRGVPSWNPAVATTLVTEGGVTATSGLGGAFTLPPFLFRRDAPTRVLAISNPPDTRVIQAATSARWRIPHSVRASGADAIGIPAQPGAGGNPTRLGPLRRTPASCTEGGAGRSRQRTRQSPGLRQPGALRALPPQRLEGWPGQQPQRADRPSGSELHLLPRSHERHVAAGAR